MVDPEELGARLTGSFLRKLCQEGRKPDAIIFYGTGISLLTGDSPVLDALEILEGQGVDLIGCGTCAGYYGVKDDIRTGRVSDMREIVSILMGAASVVTV